MVSSGGDGLIKLWTIRTNECETTLDGHSEKVWALDTKADDTLSIVSGGADSRLIVWTDITKEREDEKRKAEEENVLMEQKLSNHLRFKEYEQALELALKLDKPHMALKVRLVPHLVYDNRFVLLILFIPINSLSGLDVIG